MPFTPVDTLPSPDVRIFFSGLMIIEPQDDGTCEVFVHSSAPRHYLTIEVRRKQAGRPDELLMRHVGPLAFFDDENAGDVPLHGMEILKITDKAKGVKGYFPSTVPQNGEPDSLARAINFESSRFHNGNPEAGVDPKTKSVFRLLDVDPLGGLPSILINDGTFYTAAKTRDEFELILQKPDGSSERLEPFASLIGADIELEPGTSVAVRWRQQGRKQRLSLTRAKGISYEIYIVNDPLFESVAISKSDQDPKHDEFREYYKILHRVPTNKQFRLDVEVPKDNDNSTKRGTTRNPCMTIIKSS